MAALDFPDNPNVNDTFTVGSREWIWDGSVWVSNSGRDFTRIISDNAPGAPIEGDEWFDSSNGRLYIYYDNNWVEVGASVSGQDGADATLTRTIRSESANTSLVSGDANQVIRFTGTSTQTLTIDDVLSPGDRVEIIQDNSGTVELSSGSGVTLLSTTGQFITSGQNAKVEVMCVAAGEYRVYGDLVAALAVEYLVIAGGGGGGANFGAGGGAGGYRSSITGESSGGGASAESLFEFSLGTNYTVTIGSGGTGGVQSSTKPTKGGNSSFASITSEGGGLAGGNHSSDRLPGNGGSGGGARDSDSGGLGTTNQGFAGGINSTGGPYGAGGGGAGSVGGNANGSTSGGNGGSGVSSSITGSSVGRAGGGAGGPTGGTATDGGGAILTNGTTNTGGGGGAGNSDTETTGANGGSGVVILRYPSTRTITIGAGLTGNTSTVDDKKVTEITAGTGNVSFS